MAKDGVVLEYESDESLDLDRVRQEINRTWFDALRDPQFLGRLKKDGIDATSLPTKGDEAISVKKHEGLTPEILGLLVGFGTALTPPALQIVKDLWAHVILPRIRADQGDDSIGKLKK
jgi:hypothetical protein